MIDRTLEPEVMESADEARDYDRMDHAAVNEAFVDDFVQAARDAGLGDRLRDGTNPLAVLDVGTGTARIPIVLGRRPVFSRITAVDLSDEMLRIARQNVYGSGLQFTIRLSRADGKALPFDDASFDAVMSNSIVHHLAEPRPALAEMLRVLRPGGVLFVRDLSRPESEARVDELVSLYGGDGEAGRRLFADSLRAALTPAEVGEILASLGLSADLVRMTSDRHWTIAGTPK